MMSLMANGCWLVPVASTGDEYVLPSCKSQLPQTSVKGSANPVCGHMHCLLALTMRAADACKQHIDVIYVNDTPLRGCEQI